MKIVLGSENAPKRNSVYNAFSEAYPEREIQVECLKTISGVSSHPITASESLQGAINRANDAGKRVPDAEYYVGIEGGLLRVEERAWEIGWVAIRNAEGYLSTGLSAGIELKGLILKAIENGQELNTVLEDLFGRKEVGKASGFYGLTTDDLVTRQKAYEQGIHFAIAQFKHPELY